MARKLRSPEPLARAALGYGAKWLEALAVDEVRVALLEEALGALDERSSALRARLLAGLALALYWAESPQRRKSLSEQAVEMARRLGERTTLAYALEARHYALWDPDHVEERLAAANEMIGLAEGLADRELALRGHTWRFIDLLELGDIASVDREIEARSRLAEGLREPLQMSLVLVSRCMRAVLDGRFDDAEHFADQARAMAEHVQPVNAEVRYASQMLLIRRQQGRSGEVEASMRSLAERYPAVTAYRCSLAPLYGDLGREAEAREEFERLAAADFAALPRDVTWYSNVTFLSETCVFLCDAERAAVLYRLLLPYAMRNVVHGAALACAGAASRYLGLLGFTMSRLDDSARHFADALEMNERMGAKPFVAHVQHEYARTLLARGGPGDREKALGLLNLALETARELGMTKLVERALATKLRAQGIDSADLESSIDAVASTVETRRPDLRPTAAPDGTVTILFSDVEGFSAMTERLGDERAHELMRQHNRIIREQIQAHGGFEVGAEGDGFMIAFSSARRGLRCAVAIQRAFAVWNAEHPE
ncbi:MAG: adenylate/guanylate cyclase domain-containing protein, partial [Candidatus Binatia bacterium]